LATNGILIRCPASNSCAFQSSPVTQSSHVSKPFSTSAR